MPLPFVFECEALSLSLSQQGDDDRCLLFSYLKWNCFGVKLKGKLDSKGGTIRQRKSFVTCEV